MAIQELRVSVDARVLLDADNALDLAAKVRDFEAALEHMTEWVKSNGGTVGVDAKLVRPRAAQLQMDMTGRLNGRREDGTSDGEGTQEPGDVRAAG